MADELYVIARRVLLDALDGLGSHCDSVVLVGAQAIYVRVNAGDLAEVAPYTTDGDLAVDPRGLKEIPPLEKAMQDAKFLKKDVGIWMTRRPTQANVDVDVTVDLLSPEALSPGKGTRNAGLVGHEPGAARKTPGLEGALVDRDRLALKALDPNDPRTHHIHVAGPAALLLAKLQKIADRSVGTGKRLKDKDALDILRLLRGTTTDELAGRYRTMLSDGLSAGLATNGITLIEQQFARKNGLGVEMAVRATARLVSEDEIRLSCTTLAGDLLAALKK